MTVDMGLCSRVSQQGKQGLTHMANQTATEDSGTDWDLVVEGLVWFALLSHVRVAVWPQICDSGHPEKV